MKFHVPRVDLGKSLWARNALFVGVCLLAAAAVANYLNLFRPQRIEQPSSFEPDRFVAAHSATAARGGPASELQVTLDRLNGEFREHWKSEALEVAPRADDLTLARRLSLALVGTIPSVEEIRALEAVNPEQRQEWWTSHLLDDRRFSDYWSERLARVYVGTEMGPFLVFRRRRFTMWLGDQLQENRPYNEIVQQMISENGVWTGKPAANFVTASSDPNKDNQPDPIRLAGRTARAFLGMRIDCLQCHDDKLGNAMVGSPGNIHSGTQADFHQLAAFFGPTKVSLIGVWDDGKQPYKYKYLDAEQDVVVPPQVPFHPEFLNDAETVRPQGDRRDQLAKWVTHPKNKPFARATVNRVWALLFGKPLVEPIDDIPLVGNYPPGLQLLADDFVAHGYDLERLIRLVVASDAFQRDSQGEFVITDKHEQQWAVFPLTRLRPEQMAGAVVQASSLTTLDGSAHVFQRIGMFTNVRDFVARYGDLGEDEFTDRAGTIPQRLLMMNGELVRERTGSDTPLNSASTRISFLTTQPEKQIEAAYLAILTRRPTADERTHFLARLQDREGRNAAGAMEDLYWTLVNSTEFTWNH
jgi:hypothetical protein